MSEVQPGPDRQAIEASFRTIQDSICDNLESYDEKGIFREDHWKRPGGGGGRTRILENANLLEKGGVNFSAVHGELPEKISKGLGIQASTFFATGVSIVLHPFNPAAPIIHMNIRYFEMDGGAWWFGGGIDLTPHYIIPSLAGDFHRSLKEVCDAHDPNYYPKFKEWADNYFYIPHREETRGVGGIFFDRMDDSYGSKEEVFQFVKAVGNSFFDIYRHQLEAAKDTVSTPVDKRWQYHRRGRYVEFNLVYDRGTKFGLETSGRIESILMSLPPMAAWSYAHQPENEEAAFTLQNLKKGIDWTDH